VNDRAVPSLEIQRMQPLIFLDDWAYVAGDGEPAVTLSTPPGARLPMRRFCPVSAIEEHCARAQARQLHAEFDAATRSGGPSCAEAARLFADRIVPAMRQWLAREPTSVPPDNQPPITLEMRERHWPLPPLRIRQPSLLLLGRLWSLGERRDDSRMGVETEHRAYAITGDYASTFEVGLVWYREARDRLRKQRQPGSSDLGLSPRARATLEAFQVDGSAECGDLVVLATSPPLLGHILPAHYNVTLGGQSSRDLAVCAPFRCTTSALTIWRKQNGRWTQFGPPHGLCFGAAPHSTEWASIDDLDLRTAIYLRFVAIRLAANGKFHEQD
jgi:hypothetical protein